MGHFIGDDSANNIELLLKALTSGKDLKLESDGSGKIILDVGSTGGVEITNSGVGIMFGADTNLYRSTSNKLKTDDNMEIGGDLNVTGTLSGRVESAVSKVLVGTNDYGRLSASSITVSELNNLSGLSENVQTKLNTLSDLTPNFLPALLGVFNNAAASITYNGGSNHDLPSDIT